MKLLLTSAGITNPAIARGLYELLDKPLENSNLVIVPTAQNVEQGDKTWVIEEDFVKPHALGWREVSIVDLAAVTRII
jgi:dipeptidase E